MQNAPLPTLNVSPVTTVTTANLATKAKASKLGAGNSNDAFKQALSQQLDQRQSARHTEARAAERQAASRAAAPRPQAAPKPAQQDKTVDRSAQPKPAEAAHPAADNAGKSDKADDTAKADGADADDTNAADRAASDTHAAHAADPLADMLALVAALNQRAEAGTASASAEADAALASGGAAASAVDAATMAALTAAEANSDTTTGSVASTTTATATATTMTDAEFKAALGHAVDALPAHTAPDDSSNADSSKLLSAALAGKAAPATNPQSAKPASTGAAGLAAAGVTGDASKTAGSAAAASVNHGRLPGTDPLLKADAGNFGQQLVTARSEARDQADAALASRDAAPTTLAASATAAAAATVAPEMAKVAVPAATLYSRVGTPAWDQQLGQKVIFMAVGGEHSATMELNPPDLGPLQVVLSVSKDQATAAFTSAAPEVRQALEAALPKLREMMGEAGIQLSNATVSSGADQNAGQRAANHRDSDGNDGNRQGGWGGRHDGSGGEPTAITTRTVRVPNGAVDTFA